MDNSKTSVGNGSGEWRTPPELYRWLDWRFAFNFDLFASHENHLTATYATVDGVWRAGMSPGPEDYFGTPPARLSDPSATGLTWDLKNRRVFANPPYSRGFIDKATKSMAERRNAAGIIVALLPAATDTRWFHEWVMPYAHIEFLEKRVRFINPETGQPGNSPPGGHMVVIYRPDEAF